MTPYTLDSLERILDALDGQPSPVPLNPGAMRQVHDAILTVFPREADAGHEALRDRALARDGDQWALNPGPSYMDSDFFSDPNGKDLRRFLINSEERKELALVKADYEKDLACFFAPQGGVRRLELAVRRGEKVAQLIQEPLQDGAGSSQMYLDRAATQDLRAAVRAIAPLARLEPLPLWGADAVERCTDWQKSSEGWIHLFRLAVGGVAITPDLEGMRDFLQFMKDHERPVFLADALTRPWQQKDGTPRPYWGVNYGLAMDWKPSLHSFPASYGLRVVTERAWTAWPLTDPQGLGARKFHPEITDQMAAFAWGAQALDWEEYRRVCFNEMLTQDLVEYLDGY